ncbi:uncharacterized protein [Nicotiana sylvestris]|uniref:uncharacterized protein n=1 Tax=Nicotiana sylvestris TaxID=4096 RepID=UPI00388CC615
MANDTGNRAVPMMTVNASTSRTPALAPAEKLGKFSGIDFKHWQQKIGLEDNLYNVYSNMETSKELWTAPEKKYKTEDVGMKKFVGAEFLDYKMVDSNIFTNGIFIEGLVINEAFQVAAIIKKLTPLWKDFKNYLKYKRNEMSLEDLIVWLRIEEDNKAVEKKGRGNSTIMGANIVEATSQIKRKRKHASGPRNNPSKKRFSGNCYNSGKAGHRSVECRAPKKYKKNGQENMVEKHEDIDELLLCFLNATW